MDDIIAICRGQALLEYRDGISAHIDSPLLFMKNKLGQTPLHYAAIYGAIPTAQVILSSTDVPNKL